MHIDKLSQGGKSNKTWTAQNLSQLFESVITMWSSDNPDQSEELCLIDSGISDLSRLPLRPNIQVLNLHCNEIQRIVNLEVLRNLKHLDLSSNQIRAMEGLNSLAQLRTLNLSCNQIQLIQGLENLRSLVKLNLSYNRIADVSGLQAVDGPQYELSHVELHGNSIQSTQHVARCLEGATNLRRLSLSLGAAENPCCAVKGYRQQLLSLLPQLQVLDGSDRQGNPSGDLDILSDIPGLEQYMDLLMSNSSSDANVSALVTPKIDAAMTAFKSRAVSNTDVSTTSDHDTSSQSQSIPQRAAPTDEPFTKPNTKAKVDHEDRLEKLEHLMMNLLESSREATNSAKVIPRSGQDQTPSSPMERMKHPHHQPKRDIDETDESEEDRHRSTTSRTKVKGKASVPSKSGSHINRSKVKKSTDSRNGVNRVQRRGPESLVVRGRSPSPPGRRRGQESDKTCVRPATQLPTAVAKDEGQRDDIQSTYVQLMRELETERERRWKAEQASKKLVEHIKQLQMRARDEEGLQDIAVQATTRLKEALTNEREARLRLESESEGLTGQVSELRGRLEDAQKSEERCQAALRTSEETGMTAEKERLQQQAHEAKRLQEATLKAAACSREVEILRNNVQTLKGQLQQMQELLATREQEHRKELQRRHSVDSPELHQLIQKRVDETEQLHGKQVDHLNHRLEQLTKEYNALEDEFRSALQIETSRFRELQQAFEETSREAADDKQKLTAARLKDDKTSAIVTELTSLVKEQKGRITELSKAKQEQAFEHKERVQSLEAHLEEARRRMVTLELTKQEKSKLEAKVQAQQSLIEGMRAEKKLWGEELVQQEAGLAQDRGRMEAKIETLTAELSTVKKQLERESDAVRIKAKMVDDQTETIRKLKDGLQERDNEIKKSREETIRLQRDLEEQLGAEAMTNQELQEKLDRMRARKDELKDQIVQAEDKLEESTRAHSALNRKWKEKSSLIGRLEEEVTAMRESWEGKEQRLTEERDRAVEAASMAVEKLRNMDDAFRKQLDNKESGHQRALHELDQEKQAELDLANKKVMEVEEEMRILLQENESSKRAMEERVKKLTRAFSELQHDLF